jgi:hypothetical protein
MNGTISFQEIWLQVHFKQVPVEKLLAHITNTEEPCTLVTRGAQLYEGGPKNDRNRPVAHACFLVTSCAAR